MASHTATATGDDRLWYRRPASEWVEALPIGNGRLGGMVYGGTTVERIQLNEDTLWSGHPYDPNRAGASARLDEVRSLVFAGRYPEAQALIEEHMLGPWTASYLSLGELKLTLDGRGEATDYRRELDLGSAVCRTRFTLGGVAYVREAFVSAVDQVLVVRLEADRPGAVSVQAALDCPLEHRTRKAAADRLSLEGQCPSRVEPFHVHSLEPVHYEEGKGVRFAVQLLALPEGGHVEAYGGMLWVRGANAVTLLLAAATSYAGFDRDPARDGAETLPRVEARLAGAASLPYAELLRRHREDHAALYERVRLELDAPGLSALPTDERLAAVREGRRDEKLAELLFHYGRYLLIASSRPGTQPATLQGIWNDRVRPPWACNYTANINVQMNYWPAETCNLAECHEPLFGLLDDLRKSGAATAQAHYGASGWVCHHATDLWRVATPSGGPSKGPASWAYWPMGGAWLCAHLWEHYLFGGDEAFLRERAYPTMKEAALFYLDYLVEDSQGHLVTNPSTSPENTFVGPDGRKAAVSFASTMDNALVWELFTHCIAASEALGEDEPFRERLTAARDRLRPPRIGRGGQLQEWFADFEEAEPGHRHTAHLYGLHPGRQIDLRRDAALAEACRETLERRRAHEREDAIGWCFAWRINQYARLGDGESAHAYLTQLLRNPFPNLLNAHRHPKLTFYPMTIEANFGATAGIAELLLQSHADELRLLPALPAAWPAGRVAGLRARGGYTVDLDWADGRLRRAVVTASRDGECRIRSETPLAAASGGRSVEMREIAPAVYAFAGEAGRRYTIVPA